MAQPSSIAGTYFTSWQYDTTSSSAFQLGPIVVIGSDNSVTVDGVAITGAMVAGPTVTWQSSSGNTSSAMLQFSFSSTYNQYTFSGVFWMSTDNTPSASNFFGFATQPSAPLTTWNGTYNCYQSTSQGMQSLGELVINGSSVTFGGVAITNPIYTGLSSNGTDTNELAWFTSDGNEYNVAISFFNSTSNAGVVEFNGNIWPDGSTRPEGAPSSTNNFFGTTESTSEDNALVDEINNLAQAAQNALVFVAVEKAVAAMAGDDANKAAAQDAGANADRNAQDADDDAEDDEDDDAEDDADDDDDDDDVDGEVATAPLPGKPPRVRARSPKASGLSAKELLALKNRT